MQRLTRCVLLLAMATLAVGPRSARAGDEALPLDAVKAFAWFDGLGFPDVQKLPFVRVRVAPWRGTRGTWGIAAYGFLIRDDAESFEVLTTDLEPTSFGKTPDPRERRAVGRHEPADLVAVWREHTAQASDERGRFDSRQGLKAETFLWARWLERRGFPTEASEAWGHAASIKEPEHHGLVNSRPGTGSDLLTDLRMQIAHAEAWRATVEIGDAWVPWERIRARFRRFLSNFGDTPWATSMKRWSDEMEKPAPPPAPPGDVARALVQDLTSQNGRQDGQPSSPDPLDDPRGGRSPAARLIGLGLDAVPAVLAALGDARPTRTIGYVRDYAFSHEPLDVRTTAVEVLSQIARTDFRDEGNLYLLNIRDDKWPVIRSRIAAWWTKVTTDGEAAYLAEQVRQATWAGGFCAGRLARLAPARAFADITAGLAVSKEPRTTARLVEALGAVPDAGAEPVLERYASEPGPLRWAALRALARRGHPRAVAEAAAILDGSAAPEDSDSWKVQDSRSGARGLLGLAGDRASLERLAAEFDLAGDADRASGVIALAPSAEKVPPRTPERPVAPRDVLEDAIASRLSDGAEAPWSRFPDDDLQVRAVRVADAAAWALRRARGEPPFPLGAPVDVRDAEILKDLNAWRSRRGLPPFGRVGFVSARLAADAAFDAAWKKAAEATDAASAAAAVEELRAFGVAAVGPILELQGEGTFGYGKDPPKPGALLQRVGRVEIAPGSLPISARARESARTLLDREPTAARLRALLATASEDADAGVAEVRVRLRRRGDQAWTLIVSASAGEARGAWIDPRAVVVFPRWVAAPAPGATSDTDVDAAVAAANAPLDGKARESRVLDVRRARTP